MFRILTVCTGNVCRSPAAASVLACGLGPGVTVSSAGTRALVGSPVAEPMAALMRRDGFPVGGTTARQLDEDLLARTDLVLALAKEHRAAAVELAPAVVRRSFTLTEFAHLLSVLPPPPEDAADPAGRLRTRVADCARGRATVPPPEQYDVPDPYGGDADAFATAWRQIRVAATAVVEGCAR